MDDPAAQVITAAVGEDWCLADAIAAQWIDSGNADLLVDGLLDLCVTFLERLGECSGRELGVAVSAGDWWSAYRMAEMAEGEGS